MNKYAALGLLIAAAVDGKQIAVLTRTGYDVRPALDHFETALAQLGTDQHKVTRKNGAERIDCASGGSIRFRPHSASHRGYNADVVYLDHGVQVDHTLADELHALTATTGGEIIDASRG